MTSKEFSSGNDVSEVLVGSALAGGKARAHAKSVKARKQPDGTAKRSGGSGSLVRHDFAMALRQLVPFMVVALGVFAVAMPVSTAAIPNASIFNLDYVHDQMKFRFWLGDLTYVVVLGAAIYGCALGVRSFRFLLVRTETTAVLSLPLPRATLLGVRFGACLVAIVVGVVVPLAASLVVNVLALDVWEGLFGQFAYVACGLVLVSAVACIVSVLACLMAGTVAEACALAIALLASVSVVAWAANAVMDYLLVGNAFGERLYNGTSEIAPSLLALWSPFNPLLFFAEPAATHQVFIVQHPVYAPVDGNWPLLAGWLAVVVALVVLASFLIRRRAGERAGIAGLSLPLSAIVGAVVGFAAFGAVFALLASLNVATAVVGAFLVFWVVSAVLFRGPLRGRAPARRTLALVGVESAVLAVLVACVALGGFGYTQRVPEADDVQRVSVSYTGSPNFLAVGLDSASAGGTSYYFSASYSFDDAGSIETVRNVHRSLANLGHAPYEEDRFDFADTVMHYDVVVRYVLADGSEMTRYYDRATFRQLADLLALDDTQRVRDLSRAVITGDMSELPDEDAAALGNSVPRVAYATGSIYLADRLYTSPVLIECDATARAELLQALAEDVVAQSSDDRYRPEGPCRGVIMFTQSGSQAAETFAYGIENTVVYLTDSFPRTLAWFEANGLSQYLEQPSDDVSQLVDQVTVQRFNPYAGMTAPTDPRSAYFMGYRSSVSGNFATLQDFGVKWSTYDKGEIAELMALSRNTYYMDGGGYLVCAKLRGQTAYAYLFIPEADAPEWLVRVAQE